MNEDSINNVTNTNGVGTKDENDICLSTDKELLEDFLNEIDTEDGLVKIESIEPEIRLDKFLWIIRQKENELKKCKAIADHSISMADNWYSKKESTITSAIEFLTRQMQNYLRQNNLKSLSLPNGKIGYRKQVDLIEISDDDVFLENAKPEFLIQIPEIFKPDLKSIKDYIKNTSDIPAGVNIKTREDKFYYKLADM